MGALLRMTGCAADADDLVQETFVRAILASRKMTAVRHTAVASEL